MSNQNTGHGHVFPRPDGVKARCGGPGICMECSLEADQKKLEDLGAFDKPSSKEQTGQMPPNMERAKQEWISRYKSKEGRAIARRAWERCQEEHDAIVKPLVDAIEGVLSGYLTGSLYNPGNEAIGKARAALAAHGKAGG